MKKIKMVYCWLLLGTAMLYPPASEAAKGLQEICL